MHLSTWPSQVGKHSCDGLSGPQSNEGSGLWIVEVHDWARDILSEALCWNLWGSAITKCQLAGDGVSCVEAGNAIRSKAAPDCRVCRSQVEMFGACQLCPVSLGKLSGGPDGLGTMGIEEPGELLWRLLPSTWFGSGLQLWKFWTSEMRLPVPICGAT
jgi:hypothetical protein